MTTPYYSAEYRPTFDPDSPIGLRRRGQEPTGRPEIDAWRDTGSVSMMSVADATALRDSLTVAIEAAAPKQEPVKAPRTCWTCRHASPDSRECRFNGSRTTDSHRSTWCAATGNLDPDTDMPLPTATPCPAFAERP